LVFGFFVALIVWPLGLQHRLRLRRRCANRRKHDITRVALDRCAIEEHMHDVEFLIDPAGAAFEKAAKSSALPAEGIRSMRGRFIIVRHMEYVTESRARRKAFRLR